jgi:hypothetical protein
MRLWLSKAFLCAAGIGMGVTAAHGNEVFRCGQPGSIRYQSLPCEDGQRLHTQDDRNEAQRQQAQAAAQAQSRAAETMAKEHERREKLAGNRPSNATVIGQRPTLAPTHGQPDAHKSRIRHGRTKKAPTDAATKGVKPGAATAFQRPKTPSSTKAR